MGLYQKYRPKSWDDVVGHDDVVDYFKAYKPGLCQGFIFSGPPGCGKTTCAHLLKETLGCSRLDFREINAADARGIDMVREVNEVFRARPWKGKARLWVFDEAHQLTPQAQAALLKTIEDQHVAPHAHFVFCTTDPNKLIATIRCQRCVEFALHPLSVDELGEVVDRVLEGEGREVADGVKEAVCKAGDGSPRRAIQALERVLQYDDPKRQLKVAAEMDVKPTADRLAETLVYQKGDWKGVAAMLRELRKDDVEQIRRHVLGWAANELLTKGDKARHAMVALEGFQYDWTSSGFPGLVKACWAVFTRK